MKTPADELFAIIEAFAVKNGESHARRACRSFLLKKTHAGLLPANRVRIPKKWIEDAFIHQKGYCHRCNEELLLSEAHGDHLVALAKGGEHTRRNIVAVHKGCNSSKGANDLVREAKLRGDTITDMIERTQGEETID